MYVFTAITGLTITPAGAARDFLITLSQRPSQSRLIGELTHWRIADFEREPVGLLFQKVRRVTCRREGPPLLRNYTIKMAYLTHYLS